MCMYLRNNFLIYFKVYIFLEKSEALLLCWDAPSARSIHISFVNFLVKDNILKESIQRYLARILVN
jgi:hypothetical protein